jgi:hypothetical protein
MFRDREQAVAQGVHLVVEPVDLADGQPVAPAPGFQPTREHDGTTRGELLDLGPDVGGEEAGVDTVQRLGDVA